MNCSTCSDSHHVVLAKHEFLRGLNKVVGSAHPQDEHSDVLREGLDFGYRFAEKVGVRDTIRSDIESLCGGQNTIDILSSTVRLSAHPGRLRAQIDAHQLGSN